MLLSAFFRNFCSQVPADPAVSKGISEDPWKGLKLWRAEVANHLDNSSFLASTQLQLALVRVSSSRIVYELSLAVQLVPAVVWESQHLLHTPGVALCCMLLYFEHGLNASAASVSESFIAGVPGGCGLIWTLCPQLLR